MLHLMSSAVFIRLGYCGVTWYIPRTLQRTRKPLCCQYTWYRFYDELEKGEAALQKKDWKAFARFFFAYPEKAMLFITHRTTVSKLCDEVVCL